MGQPLVDHQSHRITIHIASGTLIHNSLTAVWWDRTEFHMMILMTYVPKVVAPTRWMDSLISLVISVSFFIAAHIRILTTFIEITGVVHQVSSLQWVLNYKKRSKFTITRLLQLLRQTLPEAIKGGTYNGHRLGYSLAYTQYRLKKPWSKQTSHLIKQRSCSGSWTHLPN